MWGVEVMDWARRLVIEATTKNVTTHAIRTWQKASEVKFADNSIYNVVLFHNVGSHQPIEFRNVSSNKLPLFLCLLDNFVKINTRIICRRPSQTPKSNNRRSSKKDEGIHPI